MKLAIFHGGIDELKNISTVNFYFDLEENHFSELCSNSILSFI